MRPIRILPVIFFIFNLMLGIGLGIAFNPFRAIDGTDSFTHLANNQRTILLITVDRLNEDASLTGVWTLIYAPGYRTPTWIPIYPTLPSGDPNYASQLTAAFHLTSDLKPEDAFLDMLRQENLAWSGYIVLDGEVILGAMEFFDIPTRPQNTEEWLALVSGNQQDQSTALYNQVALLNSICKAAAAKPANFDLRKLYTLIRKHTRSNLDLRLAFNEWQEFFHPGKDLICQFPTLEVNYP